MIITTCLGDAREVLRVYPDGSFECPWCCSVVVAPRVACENPGCDTSPWMTPERLRERREAEAAHRLHLEQLVKHRQVMAELARAQQEEHDTWWAEQVAEARRRGACLECLRAPGWKRVRFVRHRGACPRGRR